MRLGNKLIFGGDEKVRNAGFSRKRNGKSISISTLLTHPDKADYYCITSV